MHAVRISLLTLAALGAAWPVLAQVIVPQLPEPPKGGSAERGKIIAQRWCAECHVVSPGQGTAKVDVPSFSAIASRGPAVPLEKFLMNPHPKMPDMQINRTEAADLVAYIMSQKAP